MYRFIALSATALADALIARRKLFRDPSLPMDAIDKLADDEETNLVALACADPRHLAEKIRGLRATAFGTDGSPPSPGEGLLFQAVMSDAVVMAAKESRASRVPFLGKTGS